MGTPTAHAIRKLFKKLDHKFEHISLPELVSIHQHATKLAKMQRFLVLMPIAVSFADFTSIKKNFFSAMKRQGSQSIAQSRFLSDDIEFSSE